MAVTIWKLHNNLLLCNICIEFYNDPCTLVCGHTFCRSCLATFTKTEPDAIKAKSFHCPRCHQMTKVSNPARSVDDWVRKTQPNFLIKELLDSFASNSESDMVPESLCFSCKQSDENAPASSHCIDCDISICTRCAKGHKAMPVTSHHVITDLGEEVKVKRKRKVICKVHNSIIDFCCKDCHKACCHKCCILEHRKCDNVVTIESMVPEMKSVLMEKKQIITGEVKKKKSAFTQKETKMEAITAQRADILSEISKVTHKAISFIIQKHKLLEAEFDMLREKQIKDLKGLMKSEEIEIQMYQRFCEFVDQVLATDSEMDMYDIYQMFQSGAITTVPDTQLQNESRSVRIRFVEGQTLGSNFKLGRLKVLKEEFDPECKPTLVDTIDIRMTSDKEYPVPVDVVIVDVNGIETLVVSDYRNDCLKSFYQRKYNLCQSSLLLSARPWSVTSLPDNRVIVSFLSQNMILIVQVTPDLLLLSIVKTLKKYRGLASLNSSTIVACCCNPPSLDILDEKGHVQKSVKIEAELVQRPVFLTAMANGYILVSDESKRSVCCLTVDGNVIFIYSPSGERALSSPQGITTSNTGDILVADRDNNKVIQLTASGQFVRDLLISRDKCFQPYGICLHNDKLYITDGTVKVYWC